MLNCYGNGKANQFDNCEELPDGSVPDNVIGDEDNGGNRGNGGTGGFQRSSTPPDSDIRKLSLSHTRTKSISDL